MGCCETPALCDRIHAINPFGDERKNARKYISKVFEVSSSLPVATKQEIFVVPTTFRNVGEIYGV